MIDNTVLAFMVITVILAGIAILGPFGWIYFQAKDKETGIIGSFGLGALGYFWSQYLLTIPVLWILMMFDGFMKIYNDNSYYVAYILITSAILSILGTLARYWCIWLMNRHVPSLYRALSSGVGFSVIGSISVITAYITYVKYSNILNKSGAAGLSELLKANNASVTDLQIENIISQLTGTSAINIAFEGINVIMVVFVEMALIALIYEGYIRHKSLIATLISCGINIVYSFLTMLIRGLATEKMGNVLSTETGTLIYNAFTLICGLVAVWFVYGSVMRYKVVSKEGPYAHYAYFEMKDDKAKKEV